LTLGVTSSLWGFAVAIALLPVWSRPAPAGQLPGIATMLNLDAHAPMRFIAGLVLLPIVFAFALRPLIRRFETAQRWAAIGAGAAMAASFWLVLFEQDVWWTIVPFALAIAACFALRKVDAQFTRRDWILLPTTFTVFLALIDLRPQQTTAEQFVIALLLVFAVRLAVAPHGFAFLLSPLALILQTEFFSPHQRHLGWPSLLIALLSPFVLRVGQAILPVRTGRIACPTTIAWVIYPIAAYAYLTSVSLLVAEGRPRVNLFEDAHGIIPAGEMLHGELPYRDIIPAHGLIEDGLLDFVAMRTRGATLGNALKARNVYGSLNAVAVYALSAAATGSAEGGIIGFFFAATLGTVPTTSRTVASLFTLAILAAAMRRRNPRLFAAAGFGAVLSALSSLDFGGCTVIALVVALIRFRPNPLRAWRDAAIGIACALVPLFAILAAFGIARSFVTTTLFEILTLGPVSTQTPFTAPQVLKTTFRFFPEVLAGVFDRSALMYVVWGCAAILAGVLLTTRARRRTEPLALVALWIAAGGMSYAARHHLHFQFAVAPLPVIAAWTIWRARSRYAVVAFVVLAMISGFTVHIIVDGMVRNARGPIGAPVVAIDELPHARGAWFSDDDAKMIRTAAPYVASLPPDDTFFDFTNRPMLYFLFDRDCPIRQLGPSWYEPEERQRQVIAQLDRNPHIRAALVPSSPTDGTLDGVPNAVRAPLVWRYVETHFQPEFAENGITFWRRK
jgi:hypothetical protein